MTRKTDTIPAAYFEHKYQTDIDPWKFRTSDYERDKYAATIGALSKPLYFRGLEIGCSIGVLTRQLADRCGELVAIDASETAITAAKASGLPNVSFDVRSLPDEFPEGRFDLIVLSEVLYYFSRNDLRRVAQSCVEALSPGGEIVLCHWLGETDYPLSGTDASEVFADTVVSRLSVRSIVRDDVYRLERFSHS